MASVDGAVCARSEPAAPARARTAISSVDGFTAPPFGPKVFLVGPGFCLFRARACRVGTAFARARLIAPVGRTARSCRLEIPGAFLTKLAQLFEIALETSRVTPGTGGCVALCGAVASFIRDWLRAW